MAKKYGLPGLEFKLFDPKCKELSAAQKMRYMLNRTQSMFEYNGLPETVPAQILERYLQENGNCFFTQVNGEYYVFCGGLGGEPDVYYRPTLYTVANPAISFSANLKINEDGVLIKNDTNLMGLIPMFSQYASAMAETELSLDMVTVNARIFSILSGGTDRDKAALDQYLKNVREGVAGSVVDESFLKNIAVQPFATSNCISAIQYLIEYEQYLKAAWFNEIGLDANYNMKRESLSLSESQMNNDALLPLAQNMLECRREGLDRVNGMFGLNISVDFASSWKANEEAQKMEMEEEANVSDNEDESGADPENID